MTAVDDWVDRALDPWREKPVVDRAAASMSTLADYGFLWFVAGSWQAVRPQRRRWAAWSIGFTGIVVPVVERMAKQVVDRPRPAGTPHVGRRPATAGVRQPHSSSFPSGHTMAAWCAARLLADGERSAAYLYSAAAAVGVSRVHLQHHHATDVVAGAALGMLLGSLGRRVGYRINAAPWCASAR